MDEIKYIDRNTGEERTESVPAGGTMKWLYRSVLGKATLFLLLKRKFVSSLGGWYLNRKGSKKRIKPFIDDYKIDMSDYVQSDHSKFKHFNDFFYRKIDRTKRPIGEGVVSPADGKTLAFQEISDQTKFFIKGAEFDLERFLGNKVLAERFSGGSMVIIRLAPTDYHRFHFPADGLAGETKLIKGYYYSVSPIALQQNLEIFCQNKRSKSVLSTDKFGKILIAEVGATMVGSIFQSYRANSDVKAGDEKGYFAFGGSTVVLLFEPGKIKLSEDLLANSLKGIETQVLMGQTIGL